MRNAVGGTKALRIFMPLHEFERLLGIEAWRPVRQ